MKATIAAQESQLSLQANQLAQHANQLFNLLQWQQNNQSSTPNIAVNSYSSHPGSAETLSAFNGTSHHLSITGGSPASPMSFKDPSVLPSDDIVRDLIQLYFTHIHPWAPIIPPKPAVEWNAPWSIVVHAMVVLTLRLSHDERIVHVKEQIRAAAKQHILSHAIESTSVDSIQALAILALDVIGSGQGPRSWGILALLTRSAVHLGLSQEDERTVTYGMPGRAPAPSLTRTAIIAPPTSWKEDEARRRLFWLIYSLDRYACVSTGWEFSLDGQIKRRLPASDELWAGDVSAQLLA